MPFVLTWDNISKFKFQAKMSSPVYAVSKQLVDSGV